MDLYGIKIEQLSGVGTKRAALFSKLGIDSVGALLEFYPRNYEDWSSCFSCSQAPLGASCCVKAFVAAPVNEHRIRRGMTLYKFIATDYITKLNVTIFNNKYAAARVHAGDELLLFGKVTINEYNGQREMNSPLIEAVTGAKIRPIYRQTEGLSTRIIEQTVRAALKFICEQLYDPLPDSLRTQHELCHRRYAIQQIHFPDNMQEMQLARHRLVFEELLYLSLGLRVLRARCRDATAAVIDRDFSAQFESTLPFTLTGAQRRAVAEAVADMRGSVPMNRLLQGDVGSGKTAVAASLIYTAVKNGFQCALMAPTEILAEQHCRTLTKMLSGCQVALLCGSTTASEKKRLRRLLAAGEIDLLVGTHAIIQQGVEYSRLGLVITDEQHRFGVAQRSALTGKGDNPHTLVMSATPIPRTLALIMYGDLDISVLDELPAGRQKIDTFLIDGGYRKRAYGYIKKHLDAGLQGYIVCPMVQRDEQDFSELAAATDYYEKLQSGEFSSYRVGLMHGKQKSAEKESVMRRFLSGEIQLLVSTTVIEVGVDVPNAAIMLIENADRFGLSQLHQLRGRIGRGSSKSTCILLSESENEISQKRLKTLCSTTDGFVIANEDLKARGPGDFFGHRQSGLPELKIARIFGDMAQLRACNKIAADIIKKDPRLSLPENRGLKEAVGRLFASSADQAGKEPV